ncbi:toll-like receptor 6 [Chrysoperla carnea]|uniref:toll-like receptor 6 n=1 Tax=Chrysoperla carnea TaxID=189513 RepID=UPI001D07D5A9|nr:toll-like receptor 6 [Chrysoperla carnea]
MANKMFDVILIFLICSVIKQSLQRSLTTPGNEAPRGCDWIVQTSQYPPEMEQIVLSCRLRTIGGVETLLSNLTMLQTDRLTALKLSCSDVLFFESSLEPSHHRGGFLSPLRRLRDLTIEYCKIRHIPESVLSTLHELRHLSLRSHNSDWSAMSLELHPDSFRGLSELRTLDLGDNNIWTIPTRLFCPLYSLTVLNLTENRLQDVSTLGFGNNDEVSSCNSAIEVLDLSKNDIIVLPDNGFSNLHSLQHLHLQENGISTVGDRAFNGLFELKTLNLSSNSIIALPPELFQINSKQLSKIYLRNNSLSVLAPGIFEHLEYLEVLELSHNELTSQWINRDTFSGLIRLIILNLSHNKIQRIDNGVFNDLYSLQILNLEYNQIEVIAENSFSTLKNLHALILTSNNIKEINENHFNGLYVLNILYLDYNKISKIHQNSFENFTNLHELIACNNHLNEIPIAITKLTNLKTLDLGNNQISEITNQSFYGLNKLYGLRLIDNKLVNITRDQFANLHTLEVLNLAGNQIAYVEQSAFINNHKLKAIRLDSNQLTDISGVFTNLHSLLWLNVSDNHLLWFDYSHLPKNLEWLDMHSNNIAVLGNYYEINGSQLKLNMIDVSYNQITKIDKLSIPSNIKTILLNNNKISHIGVGTFLNLPMLEKVILYGNQIRNLELSAISISEILPNNDLPQFYISNNPFECDCTMEWLQRINQLNRLRQYPRVMDLDLIECQLTRRASIKTKKLINLSPSEFLCKYETHCFATCHCCEFDACDCEMICPENCTCYYDLTWTSNVVDCSNAGYTQVPEHIPMDATEIYLDGNNFGELGSHVFIGKKKLQKLYLNNSNIVQLHNRTFNGVKSLRVLHMENNQLNELRGYEFDQLENLNELYLEHNDIDKVGNQTFVKMHKLEVLKLDDNNIVWEKLPETNAQILTINGNHWQCDCQSILSNLQWLTANQPEKLFCTGSTTETVADALKHCNGQENAIATSVIQREISFNQNFMHSTYLPLLLAATLVTLILLCLILAVAYVFRQDIRLWIHSRYGIRLCGYHSGGVDAAEDRDRLYDGYVVYSMKDDEIVTRIVTSELEQAGYTLCLHHRDLHLVPGASYLADSVLSAADASRRVLLVISPSFLAYEWSRPELRAALLASLRGPRRRHKLMCILLDGTLPPAPDPEMRALLHAATPIAWNDRRFWEKLRYAMPDIIASSPRKLQNAGGNSTDMRCKIGGANMHGARYTAAPTALDAWYRFNITASSTQQQHPHQQLPTAPMGGVTPGVHQGVATPTPTQSTYVSGDEQEGGSSATSSQHYECAEHGYMALPQPHVYSTISDTRGPTGPPPPLPPPGAHQQTRTYFV